MTEPLYILDGVRTPFARMGTDLAPLAADELGRIAANAVLTRTGIDPATLDEVIFGCVCQPAESMNIARVIALRAGVPVSVPAMTVHRNCASGFEAITTAHERVAAGRGSLYLVGGVESMSQVPLLYSAAAAKKFGTIGRAKTLKAKLAAYSAFRPEDFAPKIGLKLGLSDSFCNMNMGETAELLAHEQGISRGNQDAFAIRSHEKAIAARERLAEEITPVYGAGKNGPMKQDNGPRNDQTPQVLAGLRPAFNKFGSVTPGNSSQITDGGVALLVGTAAKARELGLKPIGKLVDYAYAGCDPERMGLGPLYAIDQLEKRMGRSIQDADLIEINEAFAAQVLAVLKLLRESDREISESRLNVNGGAIALGHPVGATGARLVLSTLLELRRRGLQNAVVSACVGGGQGGALWLEGSDI
jgi:acetyl-CoA C-acetyltransferase/acetyl-CoA acyltransferase